MRAVSGVCAVPATKSPTFEERRSQCGDFPRGRFRQQDLPLSFLSISALAVALPAAFSQLGGLPLLVIMFVAMYFLLIAPNQRKQKQWQSMLAQLKSGDKVTTSGGIRGQVVSIKDDILVIRTQPDGVKFEVARSAIAAVTTDEVAKA